MDFLRENCRELSEALRWSRQASRPTWYTGLTWQHRTYRSGNIAKLLCNTRQRCRDIFLSRGSEEVRGETGELEGVSPEGEEGQRQGTRGIIYDRTRAYIYIFMRMYMCMYMCVCMCMHDTSSPPFPPLLRHVATPCPQCQLYRGPASQIQRPNLLKKKRRLYDELKNFRCETQILINSRFCLN